MTIEDAEAWERHTDAGFRLHAFPGDHFFLYAARQRVIDAMLPSLRGF